MNNTNHYEGKTQMNSSNTSVLKQILIDKFLRSPEAYAYKLNQSDRILLVMLASYMGNKEECWPSYRSLLIDTGIPSHSTLVKSLKKLELLNILIIKRESNKNNLYTFDDKFIQSALRICSTALHICSTRATDTSTNNINNNISNKKPFAAQRNQEPRQTVKFWESGNPDYDRNH